MLAALSPATSTAAGSEPQFDQYAEQLEAGTPADQIAYFRKILPDLQAAESASPGLAFTDLAGRISTDAMAAELDEEAGLAALQRAPPASDDRSSYLGALPAMLKPLFDLARSGPENPEGLYNLNSAIERLAAAGIGLSEIVGADPDAYDLKTIEKVAKWNKVGDNLAGLKETGAVNAKQFTNGVLSILPPELAPALASPAGKFFRDLMDWDQQMWSNSTDGLNLVSQAIATGKLDAAAYDKVSQRLQALGRQGPWTTQSGVDFAKKTAEMIPGGGKLLKALWAGSSNGRADSTAALNPIPITTTKSGQLPPQTFTFEIAGGGLDQKVTVISSPGYQVNADGSVSIGLLKIGQDALPSYFQIAVTTLAGSGSEEAHRWQAYPEQQVTAAIVHYDIEAVTGTPSGFSLIAAPPPGAAKVTAIDLGFAPLGAIVTLHWPADIALR